MMRFLCLVACMKRLDEFEKELRSRTQNIKDMLDDFGKLQTKVMGALDNITSSGSTYVRWGRSTCPTVDGVSRIYEGFAAGTGHLVSGGGANYICLPKVPELATSVMTAQYTSTIHGAEYQTHSSTLHSSIFDQEVPCAVCRTTVSTTVMIPGRLACFDGWKMQYRGFLMAERDIHPNNKQFVCVDENPEIAEGSSNANEDGGLFHFQFPKCGSLKCPPYTERFAMSCVVCSKE
ncbi:uncharacterized protein LOC127856995 [Dreissena polymorpha]|uniref:Uncharacterized protein n=1 Tax=Dreissena polymorpha TaxID=45954 RepID=A0A9D4BUP2_DREPO|nr:uncharacterized protein LOC127856995 [Dreissena polymorpha]KAH3706653.1 hypothetical protein DPMN_066041 [Dreissena polymorpha]